MEEPYPAPEWTSRDGVDVPAPGAVSILAAFARERGWDVRVQTSRGARPHSTTGRPLKVATLWGAVFSLDGGRRAAYAVRDSATWTSVMLWGDVFPFFPLATVTDLRTYIDARGDVDAAWFDAIRARHAEAGERSAAQRECDAGRHPEAGVETLDGVSWCVACGNSWQASGRPWKRVVSRKDHGN